MQASCRRVGRQLGQKEPKVRLLSLSDLDGRTRSAQLVSKTIDNLVADLGGEDNLSTAEHLIVRRAAIAGAMSEDLAARWLTGELVDPAIFATLANVERRQLESVGIKRRPRDVTQSLGHYLTNRGRRQPHNARRSRHQHR